MKEIIAVFIGGGLGSLIRFWVGQYLSVDANRFPWHTFLINLTACVLYGLVAGYLSQKLFDTGWQRAFLLAGLCGGMSTFSTLSFELFVGGEQGRWTTMIFYLMLSVSIGISLVFIGFKLGRQI